MVKNLFFSFFIIFSFVLMTACSTMGSNTRENINSKIQKIKFAVPAEQQIIIIYNHGITRPQEQEPCYMWYNKPPASLKAQISQNLIVYPLCSTAVESPLPTSAGRQVYLRKREIGQAIDAFLSRGVQAKHLFLAGHSNGGWTSLMMMRDVNKRFNAAIVYAPAFAGKRKESVYSPWWRKTVRPKQIKDMLGAKEMDALVFAYENDAYNRPQDLSFLREHYLSQNNHGVDLIAYDCNNLNAHQTFRKDCRLAKTKRQIQQFIHKQIVSWNN